VTTKAKLPSRTRQWRRHRTAATAAVLALLGGISGCAGGHPEAETDDRPSGTEGGDGVPSTDSATDRQPGAFGDLGVVCGEGAASGATARGVTDGSIRLTTMADPGNNLVPQLGQEYFDVAEVFEAWCNRAGGINGRSVDVTLRDARLFEAGARAAEACETDFMIVASGTILDDTMVDIRVGCGLGWIPAFALSDAARESALRVVPQGGSPNLEAMAGPLRAIQQARPDAGDHVGFYWPNAPQVNSAVENAMGAARQLGQVVVSQQQTPTIVDNARPFIDNLRRDGVRLLVMYGDTSQPVTTMVQDVGWAPEIILLTNAAYDDATLELARALDMPESVMPIAYHPVELADDNAATREFVAIMEELAPELTINVSHLQAWDAWMLWASSAAACGSDLTVACVLDRAGSQTEWTAGGLKPAVNVDPDDPHGPECFALLQVTADGFRYDEALTAPTAGIFNCDPRNVAEV
jgi:ABC-type branched-subunit amino acid transport system substrate-binding protein